MTAANALEEALKLASLGYRCFPCHENKKPATPKGFTNATCDPRALRHLWKRYPGKLIGFATGGRSGIDVLDIDDTKHPEAAEWLQLHANQLDGMHWNRTRSGGRHYLFRHKDGMRCAQAVEYAGQKIPGLDIRGDGGYIISWSAAGFEASADPISDWPPELLSGLAQYSEAKELRGKTKPASVDNAYASILPALLNCRRYRTLSPVAKRVHLWAEAACRPDGFTLPYKTVTKALGIGNATLSKVLMELRQVGILLLKKEGTKPGSAGFLSAKRWAAIYDLPHRNTGRSVWPWLEKNEQHFDGYWRVHVERLRGLVKKLGDAAALLAHIHATDHTFNGGVADNVNIPRALTDQATIRATGLPKTTLARFVDALLQAGCIEVAIPGKGNRATTYRMTARECRGDRPPRKLGKPGVGQTDLAHAVARDA